MEANLPKHTIYIKNIYEKIGKLELKKCLYCLFSQFGKIADVQCCKTNKLRGQAWLIFAEVASATNAVQCMNGFPFFDKKLDVQYARDEATAIKKTADGWRSNKKQKTDHKQAAKPSAAPAAQPQPATAAPARAQTNPPNKLLFVEGLPSTTTSQMLALMFNQYLGMVDVRMVDARPGIAFVEYDTEPSATTAMNGLNNFQISPGFNLSISYAK
eukprot:jgi/Ulvmu1/4232/UM191_0005.1